MTGGSQNDKPKRGRPPIAAQSFDEAFARAQRGEAPKRPRNAHERLAVSRLRGRPREPLSPTRQAAELAAYLLGTGEFETLAAASRYAAKQYGLKSPDTVRRYARALRDGPKVKIEIKQSLWGTTLHSDTETRPLLVSVETVPARD